MPKRLSVMLPTECVFNRGPTALDALVFAYLHTLIHGVDVLRVEVTRRVNLVAWELRLRSLVQAAFQPAV